jgi:hypothetical protein
MVRNKLKIREAKVDVLIKLWNKILGELSQKA